MPYRNAVGMVYDSGDYRGRAGPRGRARRLGGVRGPPGRGAPARPLSRHRHGELHRAQHRRSRASVRTSRCVPRGRIDLVLGTLSSGQGHATSFAQLLVEWLGVELAEVRLITGDTDVTVVGGGAHSARALRLAAVVMAKASDQIVDKGRRIAAWLLEAAEADIEFSARPVPREGHRPLGRSLRGRGRRARPDAPPMPGAARRPSDETMTAPSFPYGCAVCEVEVDPETGVVDVVRYTTVDDCGRAVNPMILHGQTHGGIAQGVGQALWESCAYDAETGQLLSATLMDYALPRADMLPSFTTEISEVPSTSHPARPARRRRGRDDARARRRGQCHRRRAGRAGRRAHRAAGDTRARLAGDPGRASEAIGSGSLASRLPFFEACGGSSCWVSRRSACSPVCRRPGRNRSMARMPGPSRAPRCPEERRCGLRSC